MDVMVSGVCCRVVFVLITGAFCLVGMALAVS